MGSRVDFFYSSKMPSFQSHCYVPDWQVLT